MPITMVTADGTVPTDPTDGQRQDRRLGLHPSPDRHRASQPGRSDQLRRVRSGGSRGQSADRGSADSAADEGLLEPQRPANDQQFAQYIGNPFFATGILNGVFGLKVPPAPRNDLLGVFVPDITRIDLTIPPTPMASQNRLGPLGGDNAGWPFGGRRPIDDVVDIGFRALAGVLVPGFGVAPNNQLGDGVNQNDVPLLNRFPFHAPPHAGYLHSQQNGTNGKGTPTGQ